MVRKNAYARTGGRSKSYCRVQGGWVGPKSDEFGRTYFLDAPKHESRHKSRHNLSLRYKIGKWLRAC